MNYESRSYQVKARQFTVECAKNWHEFQSWCNGNVKGIALPPSERICELPSLVVFSIEEQVAKVGDWVVQIPNGAFMAMTDQLFHQQFRKSQT